MISSHDISGVSFSHFSIASNPSTSLRHDAAQISVNYGPGPHVMNMTRQLNEYRSQDHLCDIRLQAEDGVEFPAHRVVLAATSPYFNALFSSSFADSDTQIHKLPWINSRTAERVIGFVYTGKIMLDYGIIANMLAAAEYLMLPQLKQHCVFFMKSSLGIKNVCHMKYLAELYQLKDLVEPINEILSTSCSGEVFEDDHLLDMPAGFIHGLILDQRFKHIREIDICEFILRWVDYDRASRKKELTKLLQRVLFECLPTWYINKLKEKDLTKDFVCNKYKSTTDNEACDRLGSATKDIIILVSASPDPLCLGYIPQQDQWVKFNPLPKELIDLKRKNMKTLFLGGKVYLLVTVEDSLAWLPALSVGIRMVQFWCFHVETNVWAQLSAPSSPSKCFHMISVGRYICVIGTTGTLESYDTDKDVWKTCAVAPRTIAYFDTLHFTDEKLLYVLNVYSSSNPAGGGHILQIYDPANDTWILSVLSNKGNDLVVLTYHLPGRRSTCQRTGDLLQLHNSLGIHWADIDLAEEKVSCWRWKTVLPTNIYSNHGWTLPIPDLSSLFIFNSSSKNCAMFDRETGFSKLAAPCPREVYLGPCSCCLAKITVVAVDGLDVLS